MPHSRAEPHGRIWKPSILAVSILLLTGTGYRLAAARYAQVNTSTMLPAGTLAKIPIRIGEWTGQDVPLDPNIIKSTDTDDRINRIYSRGPENVTLYVAYGVRIRDLAPHRPEICYTGAGWVLDAHKRLEIRTADGGMLPVQIQMFTRGELEKQQVTVLNYYLVNGVYSADVSGLRWQVWRLDRLNSYSAQIQVVCTANSWEKAETMAKNFAGESAPAVRELLMGAIRNLHSGAQPAKAG